MLVDAQEEGGEGTHDGLETPSTRLGLLPPVRVRLANEYHLGRKGVVHEVPVLVVVVCRREHITHDGVSCLEDGSEVCARVVDDVRVHRSSDGRDLSVGEEESTSLGRFRGKARRLNVEDDKLGGLGDVGERGEGVPPVVVRGDVAEGEGRGVDEVHLVADSVADDDLGDVGHGARDLDRQADDVVLADGDDLDGEGELRVGCRVLDVHRDELLGGLGPRSRHCVSTISRWSI